MGSAATTCLEPPGQEGPDRRGKRDLTAVTGKARWHVRVDSASQRGSDSAARSRGYRNLPFGRELAGSLRPAIAVTCQTSRRDSRVLKSTGFCIKNMNSERPGLLDSDARLVRLVRRSSKPTQAAAVGLRRHPSQRRHWQTRTEDSEQAAPPEPEQRSAQLVLHSLSQMAADPELLQVRRPAAQSPLDLQPSGTLAMFDIVCQTYDICILRC